MSKEKLQDIKQQNEYLKQKIQQIRAQKTNSANIENQITKFIQQSKSNLNEMQTKISEDASQQNRTLHSQTEKYQSVLKRQIDLLTKNKQLSQAKEANDKKFNENVEKLAKQYEHKISQFQKKVKENVKKIQHLSEGNVINRLLKSTKFKQAMIARGCSIEVLEQQSELEDVSNAVEEKQKQIVEKEQKSKKIDEQLEKMHELIETMKQLLENMVKEKQNILKQNIILKQKLKQSEQLIAKLLGAAGQLQDEDEDQPEDQENS